MSAVKFVPWIITALALLDGLLHFSLDILLFRGNFIGRLGPPPGAPPPGAPAGGPPPVPVPLPLPLNQMFLLNLVGYAVLITLFWFAYRRRAAWLRWVSVALIVYICTAFLAWLEFGAPNPMGLGYVSKTVEAALVIVLVWYTASLWTRQPTLSAAREATLT